MHLFRRLSILGAVFVLAALVPTGAAANFNPPKHYYLALGDSIAFGAQLGKFFSELGSGTYDPATFNTGYVDDFAGRLGGIDPGLQTVNLSCPGETTGSFMQSCPFHAALGFALHTNYSGSQMAAAVTFLHAHPGQVSPITIDLGLNDANVPCSNAAFLVDVSCLHTTFPAALRSVQLNLPGILAALREASPSSEIIVMKYYNPFYVQDPSTDALVSSMNSEIGAIGGTERVRIADTFGPFNRTGTEDDTLCSLTLMCPALDVHPSDEGYAVIANQFWAASDYGRLGGDGSV